MSAVEPMDRPTSRWEYVVRLLEAYRFPISVAVIGLGLFTVAVRPELPSLPPYFAPVSLAWGILALPVYLGGVKFAEIQGWKPSDPRVAVGISDPEKSEESEDMDGYMVQQSVWSQRDEIGASAARVERDDAAFDYVVTKFDHYTVGDETVVEVRGCDPETLSPSIRRENARQAGVVHTHYHELRRWRSNAESRIQEIGTEVHDAAVMQLASIMEGADLAPGVSVTSILDEWRGEIEDAPTARPGPSEPMKGRKARRDRGLGQLDMSDEELGDLPRRDVPPEEIGAVERVEPSGRAAEGRAATDGGNDE